MVFYLLTVKIISPDGKGTAQVHLRTETWLEELTKIRGCFHPRATVQAILTHDHSGDTWTCAPESPWDRNPEPAKCKCGQHEVPAGADGIQWYWQRHGRDGCTLELPDEVCWCGRKRSEHVDGHDNSKRENHATPAPAATEKET